MQKYKKCFNVQCISGPNSCDVHIIVHILFLFRNGLYNNFATDLIWTSEDIVRIGKAHKMAKQNIILKEL